MKKQHGFSLIMISAMYENGGNTTHRFLDAHPELFVYPFESQLGTSYVTDFLASVFPVKYRWPSFPLMSSFSDDYEAIIDEELKRHIKTPFASKFKNANIVMNDKNRKKIFLTHLKGKARTRKNIVEAFYVATFKAWENYIGSGKEHVYMGYSPIVGVDAPMIFEDFPNSHILHVVRNPYSAYADTKKRPVPYSIARYARTWTLVQLEALTFAKKYPKNFHIVRFEDLVKSPEVFFKKLAPALGIKWNKSMLYPSWQGKKLENVVPWGTISTPTSKSNVATSSELSQKEHDEVRSHTQVVNKLLGYENL